MIWSRRAILITAALAPIFFGHRPATAFQKKPVARVIPRSEIGDLLSIFGDLESAATVGELALRQCPELRNEEQLASDLQKTVCTCLVTGRIVSLSLTTLPEIRRYLRSAIESDFANGRMINVAGWHLADTEVRLCALAALRFRT